MKTIYYIAIIVSILSTSCMKRKSGGHGHSHGAPSAQNEHDEHEGHDHEDVKNSFTLYSDKFELFAESDPFSKGKNAEILAHFTYLNNSKPLKSGKVTLTLVIGESGIRKTLDKPLRDGIFKFKIQPNKIGKGYIKFDIIDATGRDQIVIKNIEVFAEEHDAIHSSEANTSSSGGNDISFLKEQVWSNDFEVIKMAKKPFREVISTSGEIIPAVSNEIEIIANTSGIVNFKNSIIAGAIVNRGEKLLSIDGGMLQDNINVRYLKAKSDMEMELNNYNRATELVKTNIISSKRYDEIKNNYEKVKAEFENIAKNRTKTGVKIKSPGKGVISEIVVSEGQFVEVGDIIAKIQLDKAMLLKVNLSKKHLNRVNEIRDANFKLDYTNKVVSISEIGGSRLKTGIAVSNKSPYVPIYFTLPYDKSLVAYSYSEVFLFADKATEHISVPNSALIENEKLFWVYIQTSGETYQKRIVKIGSTDGKSWTIISGLNEGDRVVTKGAFSIKQASMSDAVPAHTH